MRREVGKFLLIMGFCLLVLSSFGEMIGLSAGGRVVNDLGAGLSAALVLLGWVSLARNKSE